MKVIDSPFGFLAVAAGGSLLLVTALVLSIGPRPPPQAVVREAKAARSHANGETVLMKSVPIPRDLGPRTVKVERFVQAQAPTPEVVMPAPPPTPSLTPLTPQVDVWWPQEARSSPSTSPQLPPLPPSRPATGWEEPPPPPAAKAEPVHESHDICARHGMKKVWVSNKRWRCRK